MRKVQTILLRFIKNLVILPRSFDIQLYLMLLLLSKTKNDGDLSEKEVYSLASTLRCKRKTLCKALQRLESFGFIKIKNGVVFIKIFPRFHLKKERRITENLSSSGEINLFNFDKEVRRCQEYG